MEKIAHLVEYTTIKGKKSSDGMIPRININEDKIDIYDYPKWNVKEGWQPTLKIPPFPVVSKMYFDIETFSDNASVLSGLIMALRTKQKCLSEHKPMIEYICSKVDAGVAEYLRGRLSTPHQHNQDLHLAAALRSIESLKGKIHHEPIDIDSRGALSPDKGRIVLIGAINERGQTRVIDCTRVGEAIGINMFLDMLRKKKPTFLAHFNGFDFDLPFLIRRCEILGINHPFFVSEKTTCFRVAKRFNKPVEFRGIWLKYDNHHVAIVDLYHQSLAWDNVNRKLTSFTLKNIVIDLGLRKERRLELPYERMREIVKSDDLTELTQYLIYDLEDTKLIADLLLPDIYYQLPLLPDWKLQSIATGGNGSKWNHILTEEYKKLVGRYDIKTTVRTSYEGGLTGGKAGLYRNVSKIDVASLYPTIMLLYQVFSKKDKYGLALQILYYLKVERLRLKAIAADKKDTDEGKLAKQMQGALKVFINSLYGMFGTQGLEFNDYEAAAAVTAYGRAILKRMIKAIKDAGGIIASLDTDGVYYASESFEKNKEIWQQVQKVMPKTDKESVILEYELEALAFYVPESTDKERAENGEGARKSYVIIDKNGKLKANGNYRKRDKSVLEKTHTPALVKAFLDNSHEQYHANILAQILTKQYPVENLSITRKIRKGEKKLVDAGVGFEGEVVTIWRGKDKPRYGKRGQLLKKGEATWTKNPQEIDYNFYYKMAQSQYDVFMKVPKY